MAALRLYPCRERERRNKRLIDQKRRKSETGTEKRTARLTTRPTSRVLSGFPFSRVCVGTRTPDPERSGPLSPSKRRTASASSGSLSLCSRSKSLHKLSLPSFSLLSPRGKKQREKPSVLPSFSLLISFKETTQTPGLAITPAFTSSLVLRG